VAELPLQTQVRLLRVLETGEYLRVGSSKVQKTNVRVVAATNVNFDHALREGKFREDLYYRLNQVPVYLPPLRERREDILPLFAKFSADFSDKYKTPLIELTPEAQMALVNYTWPGNIRQLRNITEQINILEQDRLIGAEKLLFYLPQPMKLEPPALMSGKDAGEASISEREILYKVLFEMRNEINDLKQVLAGIINPDHAFTQDTKTQETVNRLFPQDSHLPAGISMVRLPPIGSTLDAPVEIEETLSLANSERELIEKALKKHRNKRKYAAKELGISERTLYRKIKEYGIED
jgi:transcriptional regulator with PAS, ATPase and Fis domain